MTASYDRQLTADADGNSRADAIGEPGEGGGGEPHAAVRCGLAQVSHAATLLTPREAEVLPLLQQGTSNAQIAVALGVGVETIRTHARNIYRKLGVSSRRELEKLPPRPPLSDEVAEGVHPERRRGPRGRGRPSRSRASQW